MPSEVLDEIVYPFLNFNGCTDDVWEWISKFTPRFILDVIIYPYWDSKLDKLPIHTMRLIMG